jgi:hypothetical protein
LKNVGYNFVRLKLIYNIQEMGDPGETAPSPLLLKVLCSEEMRTYLLGDLA